MTCWRGLGNLPRIVAGLLDRARRAARTLGDPTRHLGLIGHVERGRIAREVIGEGAGQEGQVRAVDVGVGQPGHDPRAVERAQRQVGQQVLSQAARVGHLRHGQGVLEIARPAARLVGGLHVVDGSERVRAVDGDAAIDHGQHLAQRVAERAGVAQQGRDVVPACAGRAAGRAERVGLVAVESQGIPGQRVVLIAQGRSLTGEDLRAQVRDRVGRRRGEAVHGEAAVRDQARCAQVEAAARRQDHVVDVVLDPLLRQRTEEGGLVHAHERRVVRRQGLHVDRVPARDVARGQVVVGDVQRLGLGRIDDQERILARTPCASGQGGGRTEREDERDKEELRRESAGHDARVLRGGEPGTRARAC
jgi:hypothetical protein